MSRVMSIADNLKSLRSAKGWSQARLAKEAGVSQQLVSQLERGLYNSTKALPDLARALACSVHDIDEHYAPDQDEAWVIDFMAGRDPAEKQNIRRSLESFFPKRR